MFLCAGVTPRRHSNFLLLLSCRVAVPISEPLLSLGRCSNFQRNNRRKDASLTILKRGNELLINVVNVRYSIAYLLLIIPAHEASYQDIRSIGLRSLPSSRRVQGWNNKKRLGETPSRV
ncbi:unnamed protein product [Lasius platythorax]|uniref:Secreted protein n=1 Tax=Lasius platythorax TaxID=488582 RepID=A0AAV2NR08_9HYME